MNEHGNPPPDVGGYRVDGPDARPMLEVEATHEPIRKVLECAGHGTSFLSHRDFEFGWDFGFRISQLKGRKRQHVGICVGLKAGA